MNQFLLAEDIEAWATAHPRRAQEILPELIIKLILCSSQITDYNFPIEKGIQFPGYDGILVSKEGTAYFPEGKSVWEFGTNEDDLTKFRSDFEKRSEDPLGEKPDETAFVFASIKIWNHRISIGELIHESKEKHPWKEIRILDGSKIALWLQSCPAVTVWLSEMIGKHVPGLRSLENYWDDYCDSTDPKLNKEFFLTGRESEIEKTSKWLSQRHGCFLAIAETSFEAVLFVLSVLYEKYHEDELFHSALIVETEAAWNNIIEAHDEKHLLIPLFNFTEEKRFASSLFAVLPLSKYAPTAKIIKNFSSSSIELAKMSKAIFHKGLETLGYEVFDHARIENSTKRSFLPLYRAITTIPTRKNPRWIDKQGAEDLIPAFLAGGWNGNLEGDREIIETLSGISYDEYMKRIRPWLSVEDSPVFCVLNTYQIVTAQDMWTYLFEYISEKDMASFKKSALSALGAQDPKYDLEEKERPMAAILGKENRYSETLRQGLCISLILLSEQEGRENNCNTVSVDSYVYGIVKELLAPIETEKQWNSIAPALTLLTEASPGAVIEKLEMEASNKDSGMWGLFQPPADVFWGGSNYTIILWSLEKLVWFESYSVRAIMLLSGINEIGLEYSLANTPLNSLYEILCTWYPQCCLDMKQRVEVMKRICRIYPTTGMELLDKLFPSGHNTCGSIERPRWRSVDYEMTEGTTRPELRASIVAMAELALEETESNSDYWRVIIKHIDCFTGCFDSVAERLSSCCDKLSTEIRLSLSVLLRETISKNRRFPNAKWAMNEKDVDTLETILEIIIPDTISRYEYLFKYNPPVIQLKPPSEAENISYADRRKLIYEARRDAVDRILEQYGEEELIRFSIKAEDTSDLGRILSKTVFHGQYDASKLLWLKSNRSLLSAVLWSLFRANDIDTLFDFLEKEKLNNEEKAEFLYCGPTRPEIWERLFAQNEEVQRHYWEHINIIIDLDEEKEQEFFLSQLLKYGRPFSAAKYASMTDYQNPTQIIQILQLCSSMCDYKEPDGTSIMDLADHEVVDLLIKLSTEQNIDLQLLASLESFFLPFFPLDELPTGITRFLLENPAEFVVLITYAYKKDPDSDYPEQPQDRFKRAFELLDRFKTIPGSGNGAIDRDILGKWVASAQEYADQIGYKNSFAALLGRLLSYAPVGSDGIYPHEAVRDIIERSSNERLFSEFVTGKRNQRGIYLVTGGEEEKSIAQRYRSDAAKLRVAYPKTAALLEKLADAYREDSYYDHTRELMDYRG